MTYSGNRRRTSFPNLCSCLLLVLVLIAASPSDVAAAPPRIKVKHNEERVCHADSTDGSCTANASTTDPWAFLESLSPEDALIEWIKTSKGGKVATDKFLIERTSINQGEDDSNIEKFMGPEFEFYATTDIPEGEVLMEIPESVIIGDFLTNFQDKVLRRYLDQSADEDSICVPMCMAIERIAYERFLEKKSSFHPYIEFIFGVGNPRYKRPSEWSKLSQYLFWGMLGRSGTVYSPSRDSNYIKPNSVCKIYRTQAEQFREVTEPEFDKPVTKAFRYTTNNRAYDYFARHSWGNMLIPLFDLIPHRNGKWKNVEARFVDDSTGRPVSVQPREQRFRGFVLEKDDKKASLDPEMKLVVYAHRDIAAGEPLRVSYNQCEHLGCEILQFNYTSGDLMADRGFLEDYPRRWFVNSDPYETGFSKNYVFDIDVDPEDESKRTFELVQNNLLEDEIYKVVIMSESMKRWNGLKFELKDHMDDWERSSDRQIFEYNSILNYYAAYTESFHVAWQNRHAKINAGNEQDTLEGYDDLSKPAGIASQTVGRYMPCAEGEIIDDGYLIGRSKSFYQDLDFFWETGVDNTYMKMSLWLHSSSNFRAHYHESVIHVALQYVENPKRVAYIGGGDNMVLSELMKYPGIELVVGMELDQQVCRSSMKYFGTSPLYHDERVEWWYGNGANALQIIPEDYFGSFDLVLVDLLTDVAETIKVALNLNLAEVAALLMKPDGGLISRNEDSPDRTNINNRIARRVVMYDYYDVPRLCITSANIASNSVDFVKGKRYDHGVETIKRLKNFQNDSFTGWSRYYDSSATNLTTGTFDWTTYDPNACEKIERALPEFEKSSISTGVLLVIEAENVTASLQPENLPEIHSKIKNVAKDHGLTYIARTFRSDVDVNAFILMFSEGYLKMQVYPDSQYVAFDLMLWGGTWVSKKSKEIKQDLVASVGGGRLEGSVSSYIISTLGMNSSKHLNDKNGLAKRARDYYCGKGDNVGSDGKSHSTDMDKIIKDDESKESKSSEEIQKATPKNVVMEQVFDPSIMVNEIIVDVATKRKKEKKKTTVLIFCGKEDANDCVNYASIASNTTMDGEEEIEPLFHPFYSCEAFENMESCELETMNRLLGFTKEHKRLDGFILDPSMPLDMGMVVHKVFNNTKIQDKVFEKTFFGLTPTEVKSSWRNTLLDRFRTEMVAVPPVYKADFEVSNKTHKEAWSIVSVRNKKFFDNFDEYLRSVEAKTGLTAVRKRILNGLTPLYMDWNPEKVSDEDFFQQEVMDQWVNQKPLSSQYLIQMKIGSTKMPLEKNEKVLVGEEYMTDGVGGVPICYLYHEATVVEVKSDGYIIETSRPTAYVKTSTDKTVDRDQIRKFSPTEQDRLTKLDVGQVVLVQNRDSVTFEVDPTHWYVAYVKDITAEGILVRPKDSEYCIDFIVPLEELLISDESPEFLNNHEGTSKKVLVDAFDEAIIKTGFSERKDSYTENFYDEGVSFTTFVSSFGSGVLTWDGGENVEVNMLITKETSEAELTANIEDFETRFLEAIPSLSIVARDVFPRGYGKVVNFKHEMVLEDESGNISNYIPHWMNSHVPTHQRMKSYQYYIEDEDDVVPEDVDVEADEEEEFDITNGFEETYLDDEEEWDEDEDDDDEDEDDDDDEDEDED